MLCYRCGSHNPDEESQCTSCGQVFTGAHRTMSSGPKRSQSQKLDKSKSGPWNPGDVVQERFTIESLIGYGPSGHVYKAKDARFRSEGCDEIVAIKVVHSRLLQTQEDLALFERSVQRAKKMAHPGIARIFHVAVDPEAVQAKVFYSMQLVSGLALSEIILLRKAQKLFSLDECEPLMQQLTSALEYAHRFTAHGMLKPENIIVQPGELRITDFAITRGLPRKPYFAGLGDALHYTAPELRKDGADVLPAADVFSLGVVLTEMLTGVRPDTTVRIEVADAPGMTQQIRAFLLKAMDTASDRRWRSPNELMQALQALVEEPMSEPVIITAPVKLGQLPPALPVATPIAQVTDLAASETQLLPLDDMPDVHERAAAMIVPSVLEQETRIQKKPLPVKRMNAPRPPVQAPKAPLAKQPHRVTPTQSDAHRSVLVQRRQKSNRGAIVAAGTVFMLSVSLVGALVWARDRYPTLLGQKPVVAAADDAPVALPAPMKPAEMPTTATVEKQKGNEPVKVAALHATRPQARPAPLKKDEPIDAPVVALDKGAVCKKGMVFVSGGRFSMGSSPSDEFHNFSDKLLQSVDVPGFCVDRYEYPNAMGAQPLVNVSFKQAKSACEGQGKRLCGEDEWERACKGPQNARFPYGNEFEENVCNVAGDSGPKSLKAAGASSKCRSGFGVVDMSGNAAEMTASSMSGSDVVVKGGDAQHPDYSSRCANRTAQTANKRAANVGFRCCADPND